MPIYRLASCLSIFETFFIADLFNQKLAAVIPGQNVQPLAEEVIAHGADVVYLAKHPLLSPYQKEYHIQVLDALISSTKPSVILFGQTTIGRDACMTVSMESAIKSRDCNE